MRVEEVTIEKFRSIKRATFQMSNINAVVGENNAGKTAVLRALNVVLNYKYEENSFIKKRHQFAPRNNTYITIVFSDIPSKSVYLEKRVEDTLTVRFSCKW